MTASVKAAQAMTVEHDPGWTSNFIYVYSDIGEGCGSISPGRSPARRACELLDVPSVNSHGSPNHENLMLSYKYVTECCGCVGGVV